jgi:hypothetical protein
MNYEKLGLFYLGRPYDLAARTPQEGLILYDSRDLVTHAVCVGMTGSGKTGLCLALLEEAAIDGIPALIIDPKGDLANLLLTFPHLSPAEFRPWIDEDDARRRGVAPDAFAAAEAERWANGLAGWQQDAARIARLREAADAVIYTPGSHAGIPVSVLRSFAAPPREVRDDPESMRERVGTTATGLLGLAGVDADPIRSREHILISTILDAAWRESRDLDMAALIQQIQSPPVAKVGVLDLDAFFPAKDRFGLAMTLNNLLAAPGFSVWMEGEPLDIQRLLYTPVGKPRLAIFSIAHLNDGERMFFVSLLLTETIGWMRTQPGTTSLRALVYMDEIFGYLPPVANPPSKAAMLTVLKQARAFGVGMVLATQNPVDLDYKALSNAGTWFVGRLQTERDRLRVLDALEGASATGGASFDRQQASGVLAALGSRVFLMHNVHEDAPEVFESRWAMSYLRGPLTRAQIKTLMDPRRNEFGRTWDAASAVSADRGAGTWDPASAGLRSGSAGLPPSREASADRRSFSGGGQVGNESLNAQVTSPAQQVSVRQPILPPGIPQFFGPAPGAAAYTPSLLGAARVRFTDARKNIDETRDIVVVTPIMDAVVAVDWTAAAEAEFTVDDLAKEPAADARFVDLPRAAQQAKNYTAWTKSFAAWLAREQALELVRSPSLDVVSRPNESDRDFRVRLQQAAREARDARVAALRQKYAPKLQALQERLRRAEQAKAREQEQVTSSRVQAGISLATTVIGAMFGRKALSTSTLGRATTAARGVSRSMKESQDVARAGETVAAVQAHIQNLEATLNADIAAAEAAQSSAHDALETVRLKPKRGGVEVALVALVWVAR